MSAIFMPYYQNFDNIWNNGPYVSHFTNNFFIVHDSHKEKDTEQDTSFLSPTSIQNSTLQSLS